VTEPVPAPRPKPLDRVARIVALIVGFGGAFVSFSVTNGLLSVDQAGMVTGGLNSIEIILSGVSALITAGVGVVASLTVARNGAAKVTPIDDPAVVIDNKLVPLVPGATTGGN
jgi:hypothetical protein